MDRLQVLASCDANFGAPFLEFCLMYVTYIYIYMYMLFILRPETDTQAPKLALN